MPLLDLGLYGETGDLGEVNGDIPLVSGDDCIVQCLKQRLRLFMTEWFLAEAEGIPYHDEVFIKNPRLLVLDALFKDRILSSPGVIELVRFDMDLNGALRRLSLNFAVRTENGTVQTIQLDILPGTLNPIQPGGGGGGMYVMVTFSNETTKDINVAPYNVDATTCDVEVLDAGNKFRKLEIDVSAPDSDTIRLTSETPITKALRVIFTPATEATT
jgi:hypothetical protein